MNYIPEHYQPLCRFSQVLMTTKYHIIHILTAILITVLQSIVTGCTKDIRPESTPRDNITVHWALSPGGLGDMGYNDIIFAGISAAASQHDFGLYFYRPESAEEMIPVVSEWIQEPQQEGTRSLFVLGASDFEVTVRELVDAGAFPLPEGKDMMMLEYFAEDLPVHTIGIVPVSAAFLAGRLADSLDRNPAVIAATLSDPQSKAAAEAFCQGVCPEHPDSVAVIELSDNYSGFYMADSLYRMCNDLTAGYDFFFPYAGGTALGMYRYMRDVSGPWMVVGMDMDQSDLAPDNMCCSMIKRIDRAIVLWMDSYIRGEEIPEHTVHGLESGLISLYPSAGYETITDEITEKNRAEALEIERTYTEILSRQ